MLKLNIGKQCVMVQSQLYYYVFSVVFCRSLFVQFSFLLLATVLPVLLFTDSDYHFDIFKLTATNVDITKILLKVAINTITPQTLPIINRKHTHTYVCVCVCDYIYVCSHIYIPFEQQIILSKSFIHYILTF